ncbi:MAG: flagellar filament capping protein FliD [Candidatus Sumerlaeia bacterium]
MSITSSVGLVSGMDFDNIIQQITEVNRRPIRIYRQRQQSMQGISEAYGQVSSQLQALQDQAAKMLSQDDLTFRDATSSNSQALEVSATEEADPGSYSIQVHQLAQAERRASQGYTTKDASIASTDTSFNITVGFNTTQSYDISAGTSLAQLRDMINADPESHVRANIINDGSPSNPYRMVLTSADTGSENTIAVDAGSTNLEYNSKSIEAATAAISNTFDGTVTSSGSYTGSGTTNLVAKIISGGGVGTAQFVVSADGGLTFDNDTVYTTSTAAQEVGGEGIELAFGAGTTDFAMGDTFRVDAFDPVLSQAKNAIVSVDGIQVSRADNTFSDVIENVTFTAKQLSEIPVTATVEDGRGLINAEVMQFQSVYNEVVTTLNELTAYDEENEQAQPLFGESTIRSLRGALSRIITDPVPGVSGEYNTLASLGMKLNPDGTLKFDQAKINEAFNGGVENVMRVFANMGSSLNDDIQMAGSTSETQPGNYRINITQAAEKATMTAAHPLSGNLAADELLTFTMGEKTFFTTLSAGQNIDQVVNSLNETFGTEDAPLVARNEGGKLIIESQDYGSGYSFSVRSSQDAALTSQLGIGTTDQTFTGQDVVGTINGRTATGEGQILKGIPGTNTAGMELRITSRGPINSSFSFSQGVSERLNNILDSYINSENGFITAKRDGYSSSIDLINNQITNIETRVNAEAERLRQQFIAMERAMSQYQNIGDHLSRTLGKMSE